MRSEHWFRAGRGVLFPVVVASGIAAVAVAADSDEERRPAERALDEQVIRGRQLVISHACGDCHGGGVNPAAAGWLAGGVGESSPITIGEHTVWPRNLTPDPETGLGRVSERQIFNALRYGLKPKVTPDVEITSVTPGSGNHPVNGDYLAPAMPWSGFRHMTDQQLQDIAAYLKHGVRPVSQEIPAGSAPADRWASWALNAEADPYPLPPFPAAGEVMPPDDRREQVLHGRRLVAALVCGDCHGGRANPASSRWLAGVGAAGDGEHPGPFETEFPIGPFKTYPRNLTPDNVTGMGRFSERQIFNALRYGLRPGETADVEITSTEPGVGNHPQHPKYLAPPMPWPAWRHLSDEDLWAIAGYLKLAVRPVRNAVPDSEGPPDFWASAYTVEQLGPFPAPPFPTAREVMPSRRAVR